MKLKYRIIRWLAGSDSIAINLRVKGTLIVPSHRILVVGTEITSYDGDDKRFYMEKA